MFHPFASVSGLALTRCTVICETVVWYSRGNVFRVAYAYFFLAEEQQQQTTSGISRLARRGCDAMTGLVLLVDGFPIRGTQIYLNEYENSLQLNFHRCIHDTCMESTLRVNRWWRFKDIFSTSEILCVQYFFFRLTLDMAAPNPAWHEPCLWYPQYPETETRNYIASFFAVLNRDVISRSFRLNGLLPTYRQPSIIENVPRIDPS